MYNDLLRKDKELYPYGMALKKKKSNMVLHKRCNSLFGIMR